jgi:hypothetical protein
MLIVALKIVVSLACSMAVFGLVKFKDKVQQWLDNRPEVAVLGVAWLLLRLLPFLIVFLLLGYTPSSDLDGFFGQAVQAAEGKLVYRDFTCMYAPLFPYLNALALKCWLDRKAIILVMMLMEAVALWLTNRFYAPQFTVPERMFKSILYLLLPGSLVLCVLGGQEDVWMWLVAIAAYLAWQRTGRLAWFGTILALGFLLTKAVFVLFCPALFFLVAKPQKWLPSLVIVGALAVLGLYYFTDLAFLNQPLQEADTLRSPNWASVLNPWTLDQMALGAKPWNWAGLLLTAGLSTYAAYLLRRLPFMMAFSAVWIICYATMMVAQQSAYSNYIFIFLLPLVFVWIDFKKPKEVALFLVFNVLCVVHPSLWWRLQRPIYRQPAAIWSDALHLADYVLQVSIVVLTVYFIRLVWQKSLSQARKFS